MTDAIKKSCLKLIEHAIDNKRMWTRISLVGVVVHAKKVGDWEIIIRKRNEEHVSSKGKLSQQKKVGQKGRINS